MYFRLSRVAQGATNHLALSYARIGDQRSHAAGGSSAHHGGHQRHARFI